MKLTKLCSLLVNWASHRSEMALPGLPCFLLDEKKSLALVSGFDTTTGKSMWSSVNQTQASEIPAPAPLHDLLLREDRFSFTKNRIVLNEIKGPSKGLRKSCKCLQRKISWDGKKQDGDRHVLMRRTALFGHSLHTWFVTINFILAHQQNY